MGDVKPYYADESVTFDALDDFAGPGGWDEGARMIGLRTVGIEWDMAACQTAKAAGHARIRADVAAYPSAPFAGIPGYIASPPCQAWSMAGKRKGELDRANCHRLADRMAGGDDSTDWTEWEDPRSALVCQPVRRVRELRPEWIALEEVPQVVGLWEHYARIFEGWGYSTWVGVLCAADYGVAQERYRCVLMGARFGQVVPPAPTHSESPHGEDLFGASLSQWVTVHDALGWDKRDVIRPARGAGMTERHGERPDHPATEPAPTVISKARSWTRLRPSPTIVTTRRSAEGMVAGRDLSTGVPVTVEEAGVLQSFPSDYSWQGSRSKRHEQVGNAVPPLLAAHVLAAVTGRTLGAVA